VNTRVASGLLADPEATWTSPEPGDFRQRPGKRNEILDNRRA